MIEADAIRELIAAIAANPAGIVLSVVHDDGDGGLTTSTWVLGKDSPIAACLDAICTAVNTLDGCGLMLSLDGSEDLISDGTVVKIQ